MNNDNTVEFSTTGLNCRARFGTAWQLVKDSPTSMSWQEENKSCMSVEKNR